VSQSASRLSNLKRHLPYDEQDGPQSKRKKTITFDKVTVYYFPRAQGFTCVPSQGGSTLGMASQHAHVQHFSILEHAVEQRRLHRQVSKSIPVISCVRYLEWFLLGWYLQVELKFSGQVPLSLYCKVVV
jgi:cysteine/serine-rich nuclear protein